MLAITGKLTVFKCKVLILQKLKLRKISLCREKSRSIKELNAKYGGRLPAFERGTRLAIMVW